MSIMGKKVWAVVCGAIRQEFELYTALAMLCEYRSKGLLDGIVISTWKGEIENIPGFREKLKQLDIYAVELDPLDESLNKFMHIGYARQAYQLRSGLDFLPEDVFVLKCRTDLAIGPLRCVKEVLEGKFDFTLGSYGALQTGLKYRIAVQRFALLMPYTFEDKVFIGYKQDLYKTANFQATKLCNNKSIFADMFFFISVFIDRFPIISQYLTTFDSTLIMNVSNFKFHLKNYFSTASDEQIRNFVFPSILNKYFALYYVLLYNCFINYYDHYTSFVVKEFDFIDALSFDPQIARKIGINFDCWQTEFLNHELLRKIVEGECKLTKLFINLYREISKIAVQGYADKLCFTDAEVTELSVWLRDVLKLDPKRFVRDHKPITTPNNNSNFEKTINLLFEAYKIDDKAINFLWTVAYDKSTVWIYSRIVENLEHIKKYNKDLYPMCLYSASRSETPIVLKQIAKKLYAREIMDKEVSMACFIFDRWSFDPAHFYTFPLHPYKISAFYWYGKFAEPLGKPTLPKTFYHRLIQNFKLPARPEPQSYADAVLEVIKETVAARFDERMSDPSIHNLVDFLIDDFGKEAFTAEQWEAVAEYALNRKYSLPFKTADDDAFERLLAGAENAETELEANIVSKLLLREKWNFPELARSADDALSRLIEKYPATASCFTKANFINEDEILTFSPDELDDNNDFVLLVRILAERKLLSHYAEVLLNMYGSDTFRRMILELFIKLEENEEVRFFSVKNSREAWIHYSRFSNSKINSELILQRNNDWWSWPFLDSASPSSYAALIRADADKIFVSIEINSCPCTAKTKLLDAVDKTKVNAFNKDDRIIRLRTATYQLESADKIGEAVESALDSFCEVGELLLNAAGEAEEGEPT